METTITVLGSATSWVMPTAATWRAVIEARGATEREAYGACAVALNELVRAVSAAAGGAEVAASGIVVHQEWDDAGRRRIGARGSGNVAIRGDLAELEELARVALDAGAIRLDGPTYENPANAQLLNELGADAVRAARVRAEALAAAEGRDLGEVVRITEATPDDGDTGWAEAGVGAERLAIAAGPLVPGYQQLRADVLVTFTLRP